MTSEEYNRLAPIYNGKKVAIDKLIAQIPLNINRAGKHYKRLLKEIEQNAQATI